MAWLKKRKKGGRHAAAAADETATKKVRKVDKKANPKEQTSYLAEELDEVVVEKFFSDASEANPNALVQTAQGPMLFAFGIDTNSEAFGGVSRKELRKDEDKGWLFGQIKSGDIYGYGRKSDLEAGVFYIVPTTETYESMYEIIKFTSLEYLPGLISPTGDIVQLPGRLTFGDMTPVLPGGVGVNSLFLDEDIDRALAAHAGMAPGEAASEAANTGTTEASVAPVGDNPFASPGSGSTSVQAAPTDDTDEDEVVIDDDEDGAPVVTEPDTVAGDLSKPKRAVNIVEDVADEDVQLMDEGGGYQPRHAASSNEVEQVDAMSEDGYEGESDEDYETDYADYDGEEEPDEPDEWPEDEPREVVTPRQAREVVSRVIDAQGVPIEVNDVAFMQAFAQALDVPFLFDTERIDELQAGFLNELARSGNAELTLYHERLIEDVYSTYMAWLSKAATMIASRHDVTNPQTHYGDLLVQLEAWRDRSKDDWGKLQRDRREEIKARYEAEANKAAQLARDKRYHEWKQTHRASFDTEMRMAGQSVLDEITNSADATRAEIETNRRKSISLEWERAVAQAQQQAVALYKERAGGFEEIRTYWADQLTQAAKDGLEHEIAAKRVLAEELAQTEKAEQVRRQMQDQMSAQADDHVARIKAIEAEMAARDEAAKAALSNLQALADTDKAHARSEVERYEERISELTQQIATMDERKEASWRAKVESLESDIARERSATKDALSGFKRLRWMVVVLAILAALASGTIGVLVGMGLASGDSASSGYSRTVEDEFNRGIEKMNKEAERLREGETTTPSPAQSPSSTVSPSTSGGGTR